MTPIGKYAQGLRGFPTPEPASTVEGYLLFYFPDREWAQYVIGAAKALTYGYNWYQAGEVSVDEAAAAFREIVDEAPYNLKGCANPAGGKIIRVAPNGHVQQLGDTNEWEEPTGDYTIPPVPARTDGTEPDQNCLAAKNAANVLQLLYENVTDSFNNDLDEAEAATALTLTLVSLIGAEFAPITFALVTFFGIVFSVLYGLLEFVGADLWDDAFTDSLVCILLNCLSNDAGVITFDYECFNNALAAQVTIVDLTFSQLRLFGQIQYLLLVIGGVDALNQAGATTAITDDDCDYCGAWCMTVDLKDNDGDFYDAPWWGYSSWGSGVGWQSGFNGSSRGMYIRLDVPASTHILSVVMVYSLTDPHTSWDIRTCDDAFVINGADIAGTDLVVGGAFDHSVSCLQLALGNCAGCADAGTAQLTRVTITGDGDKPDLMGWIDCP